MISMLALALCDNQDIQKFELLYQKYFIILCRYAFSITGSKAAAEEVVQESFIRVLNNLHKIGDVDCSKTKNFLITIVKRVAINVYHSEKRHATSEYNEDIDISSDADPTWKTYDLHTEKEILVKLVSELAADDYHLLYFKVLRGLSYREIASIMGISEKNVSVRLTRIRSRLMSKLLEQEDIVK